MLGYLQSGAEIILAASTFAPQHPGSWNNVHAWLEAEETEVESH